MVGWLGLERPERAAAKPQEPAATVRRSPALIVGASNDHAEREADQIAARVLRSLDGTTIRRAPGEDSDGTDEADPDGEDVVATAARPPADATDNAPTTHLRRAAAAPSGASDGGTGPDGGPLDAHIEQRIQRSLGGGRPIEAPVRQRVQRAFATDLTEVRVHTGGEAADLNRTLNARAFTVGRDVFFGRGQYRPNDTDGTKLLAHELAHVEQAGGAARRGGTARRSTVVHRRFQPGVALSKAHLRVRDQWSAFHGPSITPGSGVFVDDDPATHLVQQRKVRSNVTWVPAVNVDPHHPGPAPANRIGYIRSGRVTQLGTMPALCRREITAILRAAERRVPGGRLTNLLTKPEHVDFLMDKAVRLDVWNPALGARVDAFASGIESLQDKFDRIREGAEHVADSLEHWRTWLDPAYPDLVDIVDVTLLGSDLHEHGLGVVSVKFRKFLGGQAMFADKKIVETIIKPEDKSLEQSLLGSQPDSAANKINKLAKLKGNERLGTINMQAANIAAHGATPVWSTLVERVQGLSSEDFAAQHGTAKSEGAHAVVPAFYETLVFAYLAGIDDLHWENVMWVGDVPYLIDADNVMMHSQMTKQGTGDANQSGFSTINKHESDQSRAGIKSLDPAVAKSKLLAAMIGSDDVRDGVLDALKSAITGHKGRTVPIYTDRWAHLLRSYQTTDSAEQDGFLDFYSARKEIVREGRPIDMKIGPGLAGTTGVNSDDDFYGQAAEKAQMRRDFNAGVIPFFEYDYDTGHVTHNGAKVFHGLTLEQAFDALAQRFD